MRNQSTALHLLAAAGLVSLAACAASPGTDYSGANGGDQATAALGTANVATYSNPNFREEAQQSPSTGEGFSGSSQPPGAPPTLWNGTENWPPGSNGPVPPGAPSNGSDMGQAGD